VSRSAANRSVSSGSRGSANAVRCRATTKPGTEAGAMPANVSVKARPTVTAGFAKLVLLVNQ
jgi:hypothetical protein